MDELKFDAPRINRLATVCFAALAVLFAVWMVLDPDPVERWLGVATTAGFVALFFLSANFGSTCDSTGVRIRSLRAVTVPWSQIERIEEFSLYRRRIVRLHLADGSRVQLPAPVSGFSGERDTSFNQKLAAIRGMWTHYKTIEPPE